MSPCSKIFTASKILLICLLVNAKSASASQYFSCKTKWTITNSAAQIEIGGIQFVHGVIIDIDVDAQEIEEAKAKAYKYTWSLKNNKVLQHKNQLCGQSIESFEVTGVNCN